LIFVSLVHFASCVVRDSFERILDPFVGLAEELMARWATGGRWRRTRSESRDDGAMIVVMVRGRSDVRRSFLEISIYFPCPRPEGPTNLWRRELGPSGFYLNALQTIHLIPSAHLIFLVLVSSPQVKRKS
jgi:hypothetical protein